MKAKAMKYMNDRDKKLRIAAIVVGGLIVLYILGLLGQYAHHYTDWINNGGMYGNTEMASMSFSPFVCLKYVFSSSGLKVLLIIVLAGGGIFAWYKLHDKFRKGRDDDRGFKVSNTGEYGTADEMDEETMKEVFEVVPVGMAKGTILGEKNGRAVCMPVDTYLNRNIFVCGKAGSMKSRAIVRPHIFQVIKRGESAVITDPKGEMYKDTAEMARKAGYKIKVLNLISPDNSDSFNCMTGLGNNSIMAQRLTNVIMGNTSEGKSDAFWEKEEGGLLKGLILLVSTDEDLPEEKKNLGTVYDLLTKQTDTIFERFTGLPIDHPAKAPLNLYFNASENVRTGAFTGLGTRLSVLQDEKIKEITNTSDIDLTLLANEKCIYYLITSDQDNTLSFISSMFFTLLFMRLVNYADSLDEQTLPIPVNMVLDEFNNIGRIGTASDGSDFARTLSTCRSRGIRMLICVQSLGQLQNRYEGTLWAEIVGNCDIQICLGSNDEITSEYFSKKSGEMTIDVLSTRVNRRTFAIAQIIPEYTETEGKGKRYVYTMNEVESMDRTEMLVVTSGQQILKLNKLDYTKHPMSKKIEPVSAYSYIPERLQDMMAVAAEQVKQNQSDNKGKNKNGKGGNNPNNQNKGNSGNKGQPDKRQRDMQPDNQQRGGKNKKPLDSEVPLRIGANANGSVRPTSGYDF